VNQRRDKFIPRTILLVGGMQAETAVQVIKTAPIDPIQPLEVIVREQVRLRKPDQNSLMWSGPLKDIAEQAWVSGRRFNAEVWHEHFKRQYLPEEFDAVLCKSGYFKWDIDPSGERVLVGSTKDLTVYGFAQYLEQIYADGAGMGVSFSARMAA
jgi:hypothetical protein